MADAGAEDGRERKRARLDEGAGAAAGIPAPTADASAMPGVQEQPAAPPLATAAAAAPAGGADTPPAAAAGGAGARRPAQDEDVGIRLFIDATRAGFIGILKQRFEDFVVHEIGVDGEVVRLTSCELPPEDVAALAPPVLQPEEEARAEFLALLGEAQVATIVAQAAGGVPAGKFLMPTFAEKEKRTRTHKLIGRLYPSLSSRTVRDDGETPNHQIELTKMRSTPRDKKLRAAKPFCEFVLHKANKDTMDAADLLGKFLRVKHNRLGYAGTKDRRGVTAQRMTCKFVTGVQLQGLNERLHGIRLGNFRYRDSPLRLGDLKGNRFGIVLREVSGSDDDINAAMQTLKEHGFINYFGVQRFGTTATSTHSIGRALIAGDIPRAINLVLGPNGNDSGPEGRARAAWEESHDAKRVLKMFPPRCRLERQLVSGVDFAGLTYKAFSSIPRNMRMLYAHAYQSYVWNTMASARIELFGLVPVAGDLVLRAAGSGQVHPKDKKKVAVVVLTAETAGQHTIQDVVLPLPGDSVFYPENSIGQAYKDLLTADGIELSLGSTERDLYLSGNYRHMVEKPGDVKWEIKRYNDNTIPLITTDLAELEGTGEVAASIPDGQHKALVMEFSLAPSTYATMALREVLKSRTDKQYHTGLSGPAP